jgi:hypothetical protein
MARGRRKRDGQGEDPLQARAFPCAETAAMRFWISAGSPR